IGAADNQLTLRGFRPGEVVHVSLANLVGSEQVAGAVSVVSVPPEFLDEGTVTVEVEAPETSTQGADAAEVRTGEPAASCAWAAGSGWGALRGLMLLGLRRRRRR